MTKKWFVVPVCVCLALGARVVAQDPGEKSVDSRLLEILKQRGVITDSEFGELKKLEVDLRKESDLETSVDHKVGEMVARMAEDAPKLSYKPGQGFNFKSADGLFSMTVGGRIQVRATYEARENKNGVENDKDLQDMSVQRARIWFKGFAWDPNLKYEVQFDVSGNLSRPLDSTGTVFSSANTSTNRLVELKYAYVDWQICSQKPWFNVKAGEFKAPYSRQQLTSSGKLEFVDRAVTDSAFAPSFGYGLMFWGKRGGEKDDLFEYYACVSDGPGVTGVVEGINIDNNDDGMMYSGRVAVNPFGELPYSECDFRACPDWCKFLMAIGVNGWYHQDNNRSTTLDNFDEWSIGADVAMAWHGLYATSEIHYRNNAQPNVDPNVTAIGWMAQAGYMVVPQHFEVGLRYSAVDWDNTLAQGTTTLPTNSASREYLVLLGYYWHEHNMKLQFDFGRVETHFADVAAGPNPSNIDEWRGRMQFQLYF